MGYTTDFTGSFKLNQSATAEQINYLNTFSGTRRMKRDVLMLNELYNGLHGFNGNYGIDGEYFAFDDGRCGQNRDQSIIDYNTPPSTQPRLWCQWVLSEDGTELEWDGSEKFYSYVEWLNYLIANFFNNWGIQLNGIVKWQGEDIDDRGKIIVINNLITTEELE